MTLPEIIYRRAIDRVEAYGIRLDLLKRVAGFGPSSPTIEFSQRRSRRHRPNNTSLTSTMSHASALVRYRFDLTPGGHAPFGPWSVSKSREVPNSPKPLDKADANYQLMLDMKFGSGLDKKHFTGMMVPMASTLALSLEGEREGQDLPFVDLVQDQG